MWVNYYCCLNRINPYYKFQFVTQQLISDFIQILNELADPFVKKDKLFMYWITKLPVVVIFNKVITFDLKLI